MGYVTLEVPVLRDRSGKTPFRAMPQSDKPVRVLLNPETVGTKIVPGSPFGLTDRDGYVIARSWNSGFEIDSIEPLVPATGKAENEIVPDGLWIFDAATVQFAPVQVTASGERSAPEGGSSRSLVT